MKKTLIMVLCCLSTFFVDSYIESHVNYVQSQSDSGETVDATGRDLRGAQLTNLQADGGDFRQVTAQPCEQNSSNTTLGVCIPGQTTNMSNGIFSNVDFTNSVFRYVDFAGATFTNATAYNVDFTGSYFVGADLSGLQLVTTDTALAMLNLSSDDDDSDPVTEDDLAAADAADVALCTATSFCNAVMPDGTVCTADLSVWTDASSGQVIACGCDLSLGVDSSDDTTADA